MTLVSEESSLRIPTEDSTDVRILLLMIPMATKKVIYIVIKVILLKELILSPSIAQYYISLLSCPDGLGERLFLGPLVFAFSVFWETFF